MVSRIIILLLFVILCVGSGSGIAIHVLLLPVQNHLAPSGYVKIPNVSMTISTVVGALFTSPSFECCHDWLLNHKKHYVGQKFMFEISWLYPSYKDHWMLY